MTTVKNKSAVIGFGYFFGLFASVLWFDLRVSMAIAAACLVVTVVLGVFRKTREKYAAAALMLLSVAAGIIGFTAYDVTVRQPVFDLSETGAPLTVSGTIEEVNEVSDDFSTFIVKTKLNGVTTRVNLVKGGYYSAIVDIGDTVIFEEVALQQFRDNTGFPERSYNLSRGVLLKGTVNGDVIRVKSGNGNPITHIRKLHGKLTDTELKGVITAFAFGDKSALSSESQQQKHYITTAGVPHLTSVSGLHITMMTHIFMLLLGYLPLLRNRIVKFAVTLCVIAGLAVFYNLTASVTRAALMLIVCYGGELFMRRGNAVNSMGFALLIILIFRPNAVLDAGLIMSFLGTYGVMVVSPAIVKVIGKNKRLTKVIEPFIVSVCANVCVMPASAVYFGGISAVSPLTNIVIMPFFTMSIVTVIISVPFVLKGFTPILTSIYAFGDVISTIVDAIIRKFGKLGEKTWINLDYSFVQYWIVLAVIAIAVVCFINKRNCYKSVCVTLATLALMICVYDYNAVKSGKTYIEVYPDYVTVKRRGDDTVIITRDSKSTRERLYSQIHLTRSHVIKVDYESGYTKGTAVTVGGKTILFTKATDGSEPTADIIVASGNVENKRRFNCVYLVYTSERVPAVEDYERNVYYEPLRLIL